MIAAMFSPLLYAGLLFLCLCLCAWVLSANANSVRLVDTETMLYPVASGVHIYKGGHVGMNPAGMVKPFVPGDVYVGESYEEVDNTSGADAAVGCRVWVTGDFEFALAGAGNDEVGKPLYATADDAQALTGHPDAFIGMIVSHHAANMVIARLRRPGEMPPNGKGSILLTLTGQEAFAATGLVAGDEVLNGFELESILGLGMTMVDGEDGGIRGAFDAVAEIALASIRTPNDNLPVDKGITFECDLVVDDSGDDAALDIDLGVGTALTTDSEANVDHAAMVNLFAFHLDGNSDNILLQSDNNVVDVAPVDTLVDNDSVTDVPKRFKGIVRPDGSCEGWIDGVRVLSSTAFAVAAAASLAFFLNMEKTANDTTAQFTVRNLRVGGGMAA